MSDRVLRLEEHGHDHVHDHVHDHGQAHGDSENPWAGQGSVMLDIGGDIGALVVEMPASLTGVEIEIRPAGADDEAAAHHPHVAVVARPTSAGPMPSLVFPDLLEGTYELYEKGTSQVMMTAQVHGGAVTEAIWAAATVDR
jgi:hypothetical protein